MFSGYLSGKGSKTEGTGSETGMDEVEWRLSAMGVITMISMFDSSQK